MRRASPGLVLAAMLLLPAAARPNGFALDIQGTFANGTAGAGAGASRDPAALFVNPAVLAWQEGTSVTAGGMLVVPSAPFTDGGSTLPDGLTAIPGQGGDGASSGLVPWIFASHRLAPAWTVGFGLTTPFGLATDFGRDSGFVGRYQGIESTIESLAFGPALAWRATGWLAVGAQVAARRDHVVQSLAVDLGSACVGTFVGGGATLEEAVGACAAAPYNLEPGATDAYGRFVGDGWSWTSTLGVSVEPARGTTLGLAWRHEAQGSVSGDETFDVPAGGAAFLADYGALIGLGSLAGSGAHMKLDLPDFVTLHGAQRLGPVTLLAAVQWSRWSAFDAVTLQADSDATGLTVTSVQGFRDAWRFALGAAWEVRPGIDLYAGVALEQTPVQDAYRQATLPEKDSILAAIGGEVGLGAGFSLAAGWQHVEATGTAAIDQVGAAGDHLVGTARTRADLALAQVTWRR